MATQRLISFLVISILFLAGCSQQPSETASSSQSDSDLESRVENLETAVDLLIKDPEIARIRQAYPEAQSTTSGLHYIVTS